MTINNRKVIDVDEIIQEAVERERQRIIEMLEEEIELWKENLRHGKDVRFNEGANLYVEDEAREDE